MTQILTTFFEKIDDDEFVYQIFYIIYRLLFKDIMTDELLSNNNLVEYCIEALGHTNLRIRRLVNDIDTIIMV